MTEETAVMMTMMTIEMIKITVIMNTTNKNLRNLFKAGAPKFYQQMLVGSSGLSKLRRWPYKRKSFGSELSQQSN